MQKAIKVNLGKIVIFLKEGHWQSDLFSHFSHVPPSYPPPKYFSLDFDELKNRSWKILGSGAASDCCHLSKKFIATIISVIILLSLFLIFQPHRGGYTTCEWTPPIFRCYFQNFPSYQILWWFLVEKYSSINILTNFIPPTLKNSLLKRTFLENFGPQKLPIWMAHTCTLNMSCHVTLPPRYFEIFILPFAYIKGSTKTRSLCYPFCFCESVILKAVPCKSLTSCKVYWSLYSI